jgi:hypothetical protein
VSVYSPQHCQVSPNRRQDVLSVLATRHGRHDFLESVRGEYLYLPKSPGEPGPLLAVHQEVRRGGTRARARRLLKPPCQPATRGAHASLAHMPSAARVCQLLLCDLPHSCRNAVAWLRKFHRATLPPSSTACRPAPWRLHACHCPAAYRGRVSFISSKTSKAHLP